MEIGFLVLLFVLGAAMGSFVACQAWRLRYKEQGRKSPGRRSVCLKCGYKLKWYENIPIVSWLVLGGKCSKCGRKIGMMEILAEILMAVAFVGAGWRVGNISDLSVMDWVGLGVLLLFIVVLGFLVIYDGMWGELPTVALVIVNMIAGVFCGLRLCQEDFAMSAIWGILGAVGILAGVYLVLYLVSRGKWVGNGDWILGLALALVLGNAWLALIALFVANCLGCIISWPKVRRKKQKMVYFGPFMGVAFVIVWVFADLLMVVVK